MNTSIFSVFLTPAKVDFTTPWGDWICGQWRNILMEVLWAKFVFLWLILRVWRIYVHLATWKGGKRETTKGRWMTKHDVKLKELLPVSVQPMIWHKRRFKNIFRSTNMGRLHMVWMWLSNLHFHWNNWVKRFLLDRILYIIEPTL